MLVLLKVLFNNGPLSELTICPHCFGNLANLSYFYRLLAFRDFSRGTKYSESCTFFLFTSTIKRTLSKRRPLRRVMRLVGGNSSSCLSENRAFNFKLYYPTKICLFMDALTLTRNSKIFRSFWETSVFHVDPIAIRQFTRIAIFWLDQSVSE